MRVCFLGNSHMACIQQAISDSRSFELSGHDIFCVAGGGQPRLRCENRSLLPVNSYVEDWLRKSSGGKTRIDLDAYDAFVVVAAGQLAVREEFPHPFKEVVVSSLDGTAYEPEVGIGNRQIVSVDCARRMIRSRLRQLGSFNVLEDICSRVEAPVIVARCPLPSESFFERPDNIVAGLHGSAAKAVWIQWSSLHIELLSELVGGISGNITLLPYPPQTLGDNGCTLSSFETADPWHMNDVYGRLLLDEIETRLCA